MREIRILTTIVAFTQWMTFPIIYCASITFPKWNFIIAVAASIVAVAAWIYPEQKKGKINERRND